MKFGFQVWNDAAPWQTLKEIALVADRGRWNSLWNFDHLMPVNDAFMPQITNDPAAYERGDTLEGWTMLASWAALTCRIRLGCLVTAMPFRHPALLAKMAATVDQVAGGRLDLGVGAAWHEREHAAYGIELGSIKTRLDRFEEGLAILQGLLHGQVGGSFTFNGSFYRMDHAPFAPLPVQNKLPILVGGSGEKRTLKLVARYADASNMFGNFLATRADYVRKNRLIDQYCQEIGRDPAEVRRTVGLFAGLEKDDRKAREKTAFFGKSLPPGVDGNLLFGSAQRIVDGVGAFAGQADEVIFFGLDATPEAVQAFDDEVLKPLASVPVAV
ncbi:MAG TPA: LLM class flavin-dependent oxidoreductase [Candidatus Xenobia bacterium]|jgi:alkanesulfonate monooxygenase SsuD/methylene tetrahydromethanopterin reductase-like flavin-dependent oxidoreductase (luciferase family)